MGCYVSLVTQFRLIHHFRFSEDCFALALAAALGLALAVQPVLAQSHLGSFETRASCPQFFGVGADHHHRLAEAIIANARIVETNEFRVSRPLFHPDGGTSYVSSLPDGFLDALSALNETGHWVDVGAGSARAALEYLANAARFPRSARVTAIVVRRPEWTAPQGEPVLSSRFRYLDGRTIQSIPASEIGQADLVTDVYGALTYAPDLIEALRSELNLLRVGGSLFATGLASTRFIADSSLNAGRIAEFADLLQRFSRGLRVEGTAQLLHIVRERETFELPELELVEFKSDSPPDRVYFLTRGGS